MEDLGGSIVAAVGGTGSERVQLMINTVQRGDLLTMIGPDDARSGPFVLQDVPWTDGEYIWILRCDDAPIVVTHQYGLDSIFWLHSRPRHLGEAT